jgi:hypothetical protein
VVVWQYYSASFWIYRRMWCISCYISLWILLISSKKKRKRANYRLGHTGKRIDQWDCFGWQQGAVHILENKIQVFWVVILYIIFVFTAGIVGFTRMYANVGGCLLETQFCQKIFKAVIVMRKISFLIYSFFLLNFQFNIIMESQLNTLSSKVLSPCSPESSIVAKRF